MAALESWPGGHVHVSESDLVAAGARVVAAGDASFDGVFTDSRTVAAGALFVALVGERFDGHAYVAAALARGARAVLVSRDVEVEGGIAVFRCDDTLTTLGALASHHRRALAAKGALRHVIGITGSVGKTSTKELTYAAVAATVGSAAVQKTRGNLNNFVGVPLTLLELDEATEVAIVEMGMNVPGEIATLAAITKPTIGVVTSVARVHTEGVGGLEGVAVEKAALLEALDEDGVAIHTADDAVLAPFVAKLRTRHRISVGTSESARVRLVERTLTSEGLQRARYDVLGHEVVLDLAVLGEAAAKNAAFALAVGAVLGHDVAATARGLADARAERGRLAVLPMSGDVLVIDDTYNASARSVINALETGSELAKLRQGRLVAVLGDMLELGALELEEHAKVGEAVARVGTSLFVACGPRMKAAGLEAEELGADLAKSVDDPLDAVAMVLDFVKANDVVVVKGSRGMRMERVVDALLSSAGPSRKNRGTLPPASHEYVLDEALSGETPR